MAAFSPAAAQQKPGAVYAELKRVLTELEAAKVQHVLGQSKFSRGLVGIVEL